jgi:hypothetical protein
MNTHLLRSPHTIDDEAWWYEEQRGLCIMVKSVSSIKELYIPWRLIRAALRRKDRKA